jgi:nicotinamidase-related amidase
MNLLIIVDYQNDFVAADGQIARKVGAEKLQASQKLAPKLQTLIDTWHAKKNPVLFLISDYRRDGYKGYYKKAREKNMYVGAAAPGTRGSELYQLKPEKEDLFVTKKYFDGFYETLLEQKLQDLKAQKIFLCGVNTDVCVFHTAIGSMIRGYETMVIEDATETISPNKQLFLDYLQKYVGVQIVNSSSLL